MQGFIQDFLLEGGRTNGEGYALACMPSRGSGGLGIFRSQIAYDAN